MAIYSGDIFAENYTVSSSVTNVQIAAASGSMKFGDSGDDTHQFTGSLFISGSRIDIDDGNKNTVLGNLAGDALTTAYDNVTIGYSAGTALTTAGRNVAIGKEALLVHTTGGNNIAIGHRAMFNTDAGSTSLGSNGNVAIGESVMGGAWANANSNSNIAIGNAAMGCCSAKWCN